MRKIFDCDFEFVVLQGVVFFRESYGFVIPLRSIELRNVNHYLEAAVEIVYIESWFYVDAYRECHGVCSVRRGLDLLNHGCKSQCLGGFLLSIFL